MTKTKTKCNSSGKKPVASNSATNTYRRRKTAGQPIGPFGYLVMKAVQALGPDRAYGMQIDEALTEHLREIPSLAQIYVVLNRLEKRGFLKSRERASPTGASRKVVAYALTPKGAEAMERAAAFYEALREPITS